MSVWALWVSSDPLPLAQVYVGTGAGVVGKFDAVTGALLAAHSEG